MKKLITMALSATLVGTMTLSMFGGIAGNAEEQEYYEGFLSDSSESTEVTEYTEDVLPDLSEPTEATEYTEDILTDSSESTEATEYTEDVLPDLPEPTEEREYYEGLLPDPPEADDFYTIVTDEDFPTTYALSDESDNKVDLSASAYFPGITDQGHQGSCTAVAITHYQYSYEVNKLNGATSDDKKIIYSPKWVYNLATNAEEGISPMSAYEILKNYGCLKNSDYPYTGEQGDFIEWPSGLDAQKIEALQTRVVNAYRYDMPSDVQITEPSDSDLNNVKQLLKSGKILIVSTTNRWIAGVQNGEGIAYRCYASQGGEKSGGHTLTIVGYNDSICYDINGNGKIEASETGAFKIANSWGTDFNNEEMGVQSNTGYFWVMYDALNPVSANSKNWEVIFPRNRMPAFQFGDTLTNSFYYIDVAHKDVNFIGKLGINTSNRLNLTLKIKRSASSDWVNYDSKELFPFSAERDGNQQFSGNIYFDYDDFASPIKDYCKYYYWHAHLAGISSGDTFSLAILDNLGNVIKSNKNFTKNNSQASCNHYISIEKGDVNYDGKIDSNDENMLNNYNLRIVKFSNVQNYIGDFNNDGKVTGADTVALRKYILANGG